MYVRVYKFFFITLPRCCGRNSGKGVKNNNIEKYIPPRTYRGHTGENPIVSPAHALYSRRAEVVHVRTTTFRRPGASHSTGILYIYIYYVHYEADRRRCRIIASQ